MSKKKTTKKKSRIKGRVRCPNCTRSFDTKDVDIAKVEKTPFDSSKVTFWCKPCRDYRKAYVFD